MLHRLLLLVHCAAILLVVSGCGCGGRTDESSGPPHALFKTGPRRIVLISLDNLRADRLSCYGNPRPTSPFLDDLAANGLRFSRSTCPANWTLPSHMSLFTGLYAFRHGVVRTAHKLDNSVPSLVELLRIAGFRTGAITGGGYLQAHYGFGRGFETFYAAPALSGSWPENLRRAKEWLESHGEEDAFLFLHTYEIHEPFTPPKQYVDRFLPNPQTEVDGSIPGMRLLDKGGATELEAQEALARYDAGILYTDELLGEWYRSLEPSGLLENLLLVVTSDHGEQFWEHGRAGHGHNYLGRELTDVPLIVRLPGNAGGGRVVGDEVSFLDVLPTLLDAAGVPLPAALDGGSLLPVLRGEELSPQDPTWRRRTAQLPGGNAGLFLCEGFHFLATGSSRWKAVVPQPTARGKRLREEPRLYDRQSDPRELRPLPLAGPEAAALQAALDSLWVGGRAAAAPGVMDLDQETLKQLRTLGYTQ